MDVVAPLVEIQDVERLFSDAEVFGRTIDDLAWPIFLFDFHMVVFQRCDV